MADQEALARYRALPYSREIERVTDDDGTYYVCRFPDLPGLVADGDTPLEAANNANQAFDDFILALLKWGHEIPEPQRIIGVESSGPDAVARLLRSLKQVPYMASHGEDSVSVSESEKQTVHGDLELEPA